jgi:hypothetical protein
MKNWFKNLVEICFYHIERIEHFMMHHPDMVQI